MPRLDIDKTAEPTRTFEWREGSVGIGRHEQNHVTLPDADVSRFHAAIFADADGGFRLRDLGSRKGVRLGARRIDSRVLDFGDTFQVGGFRLTFLSSAATDELAVLPIDDDAAGTVAAHELPSAPAWLSGPGSGGEAGQLLRDLLVAIRKVGSHLDADGMLTALLDSVDAAAAPSECCVALVRDDGTLDVRARHSSASDRARTPLPMRACEQFRGDRGAPPPRVAARRNRPP